MNHTKPLYLERDVVVQKTPTILERLGGKDKRPCLAGVGRVYVPKLVYFLRAGGVRHIRHNVRGFRMTFGKGMYTGHPGITLYH
jgi:hypothetical protein